MLLWEGKQIVALKTALNEARAGSPTLLTIWGDPGSGKSSLLDELMLRGPDFEVSAAAGTESEGSPTAFGMLRDLGVDLRARAPGTRITPYAAAQSLRVEIDRWSEAGPVLLRLDDVQWADPESLETVQWLLNRTEGDRLLVAAAARASAEPRLGNALFRGRVDGPSVIRVELHGLSRQLGQRLVAVHRPGLSGSAARRLWEHTGGNPLYLTALLAEFEEHTLSQARRRLPAPAEFAAVIERRRTRLPHSAHRLLEAVAVLGTGWSSIADITDVAEVHAPAAIQAIVDANLVNTRQDHVLMVTPAHALIRAAVYQQIPFERRRVLHLRAAAMTTGRDALEHRLAAASAHDDALADDLETWAHALHNRHEFREAAHYFRAAATVTSSVAGREYRRWEARWDTVLFRRAPYGPRAREPGTGPITAHAASVLALGHLYDNNIRKALGLLDGLDRESIAMAPDILRYRLGVLTAYARMLTGASTDRINASLVVAQGAGVQDAALRMLESPTRGHMAARTLGGAFADLFRDLPDNPADATLANLSTLVWRGLYRVSILRPREAAADLVAAVSITSEHGAPESFHTYVGLARWLLGEWPLARVSFDVGLEVFRADSGWAPEYEAALLHSTEGRLADADGLLDRALERRAHAPWPEGRLNLLLALVVRCHATGNPRQRIDEMRALYPDLDNLLDRTWPEDTLVLMHAGMFAIMSDDLDTANKIVTKMGAVTEAGPSLRPAVTWLKGLLADARSEDASAIRLVREAADDDSNELPLYRAHMWADLARVAGDKDAALRRSSLDRALEIYRALGARPYVDRLEHWKASLSTVHKTGPGPLPQVGPPAALTKREQDVLTLVANGLSYAQIAQELFVTCSTVSYHLSNIYAKFSVRSRHELTAFVRAHPDVLKAASRLPA